MILLDTSGVLAWLDASQRQHEAVARAMAQVPPPYVLSPFVLAELDYLVARRVGGESQRALLEEVARGAFRLVPFSAADVGEALEIIGQFADLEIGLADASIAVLARRLDVDRVLTLDERHFRVLPGPGDRPFELLPSDMQS